MVPYVDLSTLQTEGCNDKTSDIDVVHTEDMWRIKIKRSRCPCLCAFRPLPPLSTRSAPNIRRGGRVIYMGVGTSGRLGVLDASEMQWRGIIAVATALSGLRSKAQRIAQHSAPTLDPPLSPELDSVIGLAASGRTPPVLGALDSAREAGCFTAGIRPPSAMQGVAELVVECPVGPEVVTGSTRIKSGTAQKMISTGVQLHIGKTYGNLMVDVKRSNVKLISRARLVFRSVLSDDEAIDHLMEQCGDSVKTAIVAARWDSPKEASERLAAADGVLKLALE